MILSSSTKEKIMNVRDYYEKKDQLVDLNFMNEILKIIQKEEAFKEKLEYEFTGERIYGPAYTNTKNGVVYFNMDLFIRYIKKQVEYSFLKYPKKDMIKYYNFMASVVIFHECSHVWQRNGLENYSEINRLYSDTWRSRNFSLKEIMKIIRLKINILRIDEHAYFERQANIDAFRKLVEMYQGYDFLDFIELQHIYNLSFKPKRESIVHDTLYALLLEYNYSCEGIPQDLLFEVGLPTDKKYSEEVYAAIDKYNSNELSYEKVIEKIKKY